MRSLSDAAPSQFASVRFVLTDMDETLTYRGRLSAATYDALERLQSAGVKVIPVTAAPAGWCDQMARMWPVDGVIGENGGLFIQRAPNGHGVLRRFWHGDAQTETVARLCALAETIAQETGAVFADDQPFRLTSVAFAQPDSERQRDRILAALKAAGTDATVNNLWVLGWLGGYDKLTMARRILQQAFDLDIDAEPEAVLYCGDSANDAPMFQFFRHTVGVSTVRNCLGEIPVAPRWVTQGPGGAGFVEAANAVLAGRK